MDQNTFLGNIDPAALDGMYQQYRNDPASVSTDWARFFEGFDLARTRYPELPVKAGMAAAGVPDSGQTVKEFRVIALINAYRERGHLFTRTNPVRDRRTYSPTLDLENFGLADADLATEFEAGSELGIGRATLAAIVDHLKATYCQSIGAEYRFIRDPERVQWLQQRMEKDRNTPAFSLNEKKEILRKLGQAVVFERFLGKKFIGQKRFSLEGGETLIPALNTDDRARCKRCAWHRGHRDRHGPPRTPQRAGQHLQQDLRIHLRRFRGPGLSRTASWKAT
jgi:2-oxoglutarate dehydrogenase E1 component